MTYHDDPALSRSDLREIYTNVERWHRWRTKLTPRPGPTKNQVFGLALDELLCFGRGPDPLPKDAVIIPDEYLKKDGSRNGSSQKYREFIAELGDTPCFTPREVERLKAESEQQRKALDRCVESIESHDEARTLMFDERAQNQVILTGTIPHRRRYFDAKSMPDQLNPGDILVDLKALEDPSPGGFYRSMEKYWYDTQCYMASRLYGQMTGARPKFFFVCVRNTEPHDTAVYRAMPWMLESGRERMEAALDRFMEAEQNEHWKNPWSSGVIHLEQPRWWRRAEEYDLEPELIESEE